MGNRDNGLLLNTNMEETSRAIRRRDIVGQAALYIVLTIVGYVVLRGHDLSDDAYITAHYAQNLAHGNGWVWNPGTPPTDGTTAPLWALLLAGIILLKLPLVPTVLWLNALCYGILGVAACALARRLGGQIGGLMCLISMVGLAVLLPDFTGMETTLYGALLILAFLAWDADSIWLAFLCAGLLPLVRGEGIFLYGILLMTLVVWRRGRFPFTPAILGLVPFVAWEAFSLYTFHSLLPNSFLAKHAQTAVIGGKLSIGAFATLVWPEPYSDLLWLGAIIAIVVAWQRATVRLLALWLAIYTVFYGLVASVPLQPWYVAPAWWVAAIILSSGVGYSMRRAGRSRLRIVVSTALCVGCAFGGLLPSPQFLRYDVTAPSDVPTADVHHRAAAFLAAQPHGLVAAPEVGIIGYYSGDPVVDLVGLVSPEVVPHLANSDYTWVLKKETPPYVLLWTLLCHGPGGQEFGWRIWHDQWFRTHYRIIWAAEPRSPGSYVILSYGGKAGLLPIFPQECGGRVSDTQRLQIPS